jgi:hypothetical protein
MANKFQKAQLHLLSRPAWRSRRGTSSQRRVGQESTEGAAVGVRTLPDKNGENPVDVHPEDMYNMDETGLYYGQQPSRTLARGRTAGNTKDKRHDCGSRCQCHGHRAAAAHNHPHSAKTSGVPKEVQCGVSSECALVLQQDCMDAVHSVPSLDQKGALGLNQTMT